ncbi:MAG: GntR family transcriptional regulator [Verrucomicrobiae bacterium]|nr:GntR family transcriptional regulator [Verrucomicrobiae bacterium]MDW7980048.1 GntR family transcriptional regulator [Verrucomicrobiales bacterium]
MSEKTYHYLRKKLLAGEIHPGSRLDYKKIAEELNISVTPVREAMGKLASEGLIELVPRAGAVVRKLGRQEAEELYGVREAIETYAAAKAAAKIANGQLQQLERLLDNMHRIISEAPTDPTSVLTGEKLAEFLEADLAFHMTIIEAAGNTRLAKLAADGHILSRIFGTERFGHSRELLEEAEDHHAAIFEALKKRDAAGAARMVSEHINRSLELTVSHLNQAGRELYWRPELVGSIGVGLQLRT